MDYKEYKAKRLTNEERLAIMSVDMIARSFEHNVGKLGRRLEGTKNVKRDLGMIRYICDRLLRAALGDSPQEIADHLIRQSRDFILGLERVSPVRRTEEVVMPLEDEWQFVHICLESRCGICLKTGEDCRRCGVRKLLRKYVDEPEPGSLTECGFMGCDLGDSKKLNKQERL